MNNAERMVALVDELAALDGERPWVEFKVNNCDPDRIGTLISAVANAARIADESCGYVVWGIEDATHQIVGSVFRPMIEKAHGQPLELWLNQTISPSLHFKFHEIAHPAARVVLLEIPAASNVPTKFKNISYVRLGSATPKIADHPAYEASLLAKLRPFVWEQGVARAFVKTEEVLELLDIDAYFSLTNQAVPGAKEAVALILAYDRLIAKDVGGRWNVLNLGAILFARDITSFEGLARKAMRVIKYNGGSRVDSAHDKSGVRGVCCWVRWVGLVREQEAAASGRHYAIAQDS